MKKLEFLTLLSLLLPMWASAYGDKIDGIYYKFSGNEAEVTQCNKKEYYSGAVVIPQTVRCNGTTYHVTSIGEAAFYGCEGLTSITIPKGVTSIGRNAFHDCRSLTLVTIPNSVTSIGNGAFGACSSLTSINIPNSVTSIGNSVFSTCSGLTSITIPKGVTSIKDYAFHGCSSLTSVTIPNSVTSIGEAAFSRCSALTSVTIPASVTSIGRDAFSECSGLTSINIPNSVTSIGRDAFKGCFFTCDSITNNSMQTSDNNWGATLCKEETSDGLLITDGTLIKERPWATSVIIPMGVDSIVYAAFRNLSVLTSIKVETGNLIYDSRNDCNAIVETAKNTLLVGCQNTTIPNSVTSIGSFAFSGCKGLTSITIPESVTSIGYYSFSGCKGLTSITIPESVTSIGDYAFSGCKGLTSITIPNSVKSIGSGAFQDCSSLTSITIPESVTSIGYDSFWGCSSLTSITIPESVTSIGGSAFSGCEGLTSITIPESVTSIGGSAFFGCEGLTSITIPKGVTSIGRNAFYSCRSLTSVTIPNSVTSIGGSAFRDCSSLTSITIPASVTSIDSDTFRECSSLTSVTIPNSVTSIGDYAFLGCSNLDYLYIQNTKDNVKFESHAMPPLGTRVIYKSPLDNSNEKGCPPILSILKNSLQIKGLVDDNALYSNSRCTLVAQIHNDGERNAQMCVAKVSLQGKSSGIKMNENETFSIEAGKTKEISIPFHTSSDTRNGEATFTLQIIEKNGYNSETASVTVPIYAHGTNQLSAEGLRHRKAADELVKIAKKPEDLFGAIEEYKLILDTDPSYSDAYYNLAELYKKVGNEMDKKYYSDAKSYYIQFKRLVPEESAEIDDKLYLLERLMKQ